MKTSVKEKIKEREEIIQRIKKIFIERLRLPLKEEEINEDAPLFGLGLGLDSVDALEIVVGLEQEFGINISDEEMQILRSINSIVDYILEKKSKGPTVQGSKE